MQRHNFVVMYRYERWTINKSECNRTAVFELCYWRILLRVHLDSKITPVNLKEINPEYSLDGLMLKLKLQYFSHLMRRADSLEKTLIMGKIVGRRRRQQQRMRWLYGISYSVDMTFSKFREIVKDREVWHATAHGVLESDMT